MNKNKNSTNITQYNTDEHFLTMTPNKLDNSSTPTRAENICTLLNILVIQNFIVNGDRKEPREN